MKPFVAAGIIALIGLFAMGTYVGIIYYHQYNFWLGLVFQFFITSFLVLFSMIFGGVIVLWYINNE